MSKFNIGDKVEVDLFDDGVYRPATVRSVSESPRGMVYTVDVETCTSDDPKCIWEHSGYLSTDRMTRARRKHAKKRA